MSEPQSAPLMVPITDADMERFHRNLPAAIARREGAFLGEEVVRSLRMAITGLVPIAGLVWWGWSGGQMIAFLLIGAWVGIVLDAVKYFLLRERAEAFAAAMYDDLHVWVVTQSLREGKREAPEQHLRARWQPQAGVFVDLLFGGVGTAAVLAFLSEAGAELPGLDDTGFVRVVGAMVGLSVASAVWEVARHRTRPSRLLEGPLAAAAADRPVQLMPGLRGVGLFMLVFIVGPLSQSEDASGVLATRAMLVVNGLLVLLALVNLGGALDTLGDTRWLKRYREEHGL